MDFNNMTPPVNPTQSSQEPFRCHRRGRSVIWPLILILVGVSILADNFGIHNLFDHAMKYIIPIGMIGVGGFFLMEYTNKHSR